MRSKIVLNIKAHKKWSYGPMHCLPVQANKKFMLAEKADGGYGPFKPEVHFSEYDGIEHCRHAINYWLKHEEERKQFSLNAYKDMVKTCDFTEILRKALGAHPEKNLPSLLSIIEPKKVKVVKPKKVKNALTHFGTVNILGAKPKAEEPKVVTLKYENFNIQPGMTTWTDMPADYKRDYLRMIDGKK